MHLIALFRRTATSKALAASVQQQSCRGLSTATTTITTPAAYRPQELPITVTNFDNEPLEQIMLNEDIFGQDVRKDIVHRVVTWQLNKRRGISWAKTKDRGEVRGSTRKMFKQKGGGRARQGDRREPHLKGGGHAHAKKPRDFTSDLPRQVRRLGLKIALSAKYAEGNLIVLDSLALDTHRTRPFSKTLETLGFGKDRTALVIRPNESELQRNFELASQNLFWWNHMPVRGANVYDILKHHTLIVTKDSLPQLEERLIRDQ